MAKKKDFSDYYFSDLFFTDMIHGILIRSPISNGTIREINFQNDESIKFSFFTEENIPGKKHIETLQKKTPVFASEKILYLGQPIGIITGKNLNELEKISSNIKFAFTENYNEKHSFDDEVFTDSDILERKIFNKGDCDSIFLTSTNVVEKKFNSKIVYTNKGECQGAIANYNGDELIIYTPTKWQSNLRKNLSKVLNIEEKKIIIHKTKSNDFGTNSIWLNTLIACQVSVAAYNLKKTVKLVLSRNEQEEYFEKPLPVSMRVKLSCNENGKINAISTSIIVKCGFINPFIKEILDRLSIASCNIYDSDNIRIEAFAVKSLEHSYSANMHWIDAQVLFGIENIIQKMISKFNFDPIEFRLMNLSSAKKENNSKPFFINSSTLPMLFDLIFTNSDFNRKYYSYKVNNQLRKNFYDTVPIKGIGFAASYEGSGFFNSLINPSNFSMEVLLDIDNSVIIFADTPSNSIKNIWKKIASEILEVNVDKVKLNNNFIESKEPALPETLNDNISIMTQLLIKCCDAIQSQRFRNPLPIKVKRSFTGMKKSKWNSQEMLGSPFYNNSLGIAITEVEIDSCTYIEKIKSIWIAIDGGKILNYAQANNSIKKAIQKVLRVFHKDVELSCDDIKIKFLKSEENPKQIGEIIYNILPASLTNAIDNALSNSISKLPIEMNTLFPISDKKENKYENNTDN
ncbi:MAG: molybdopterin-dependent oxidoreductase [Treponema sp.]|nr:molybdopterin-dependent oxidoreductase [Treponema sp.]